MATPTETPQDRVIPNEKGVEEAVLGAMLIGGAEPIAIARDAGLSVETFYNSTHRTVCRAIFDIDERSGQIDQVTVADELTSSGKLDSVGGAPTVARLASEMATWQNIEYHTKIIVELADRRGMINRATQVVESAYNRTVDIEDIRSQGMDVVREFAGDEQVVYTTGEIADIGDRYIERREN